MIVKLTVGLSYMILILRYVMNYTYWFAYVETFLHPGIYILHLAMVCNPFNVFLNLVCSYYMIHLTTARMAIKKASAWEDVVKRQPLTYCWWQCKLVQPLWKTIHKITQKIKNKAYHMIQWFHFWVYCSKEMEPGFWQDSTSMFSAESLTIARVWKQPKCSSVDE